MPINSENYDKNDYKKNDKIDRYDKNDNYEKNDKDDKQ